MTLDTTETPDLPGFDKVAVLGEALWLMQQSQVHRHLFVTDIDWMLVPPVALEQYRLWKNETMPVAFASWAFLSEEAEGRMLEGYRNLTEDDWNSGDRAWLMDILAPFGGQEEAVEELKDKIFGDRPVKSVNVGERGAVQVFEI